MRMEKKVLRKPSTTSFGRGERWCQRRKVYESLRSIFWEISVGVCTSGMDTMRTLKSNGYGTYFSEFVSQFPFFWHRSCEDSTKIARMGAKGMEGSVDTLWDTLGAVVRVSQLITTSVPIFHDVQNKWYSTSKYRNLLHYPIALVLWYSEVLLPKCTCCSDVNRIYSR